MKSILIFGAVFLALGFYIDSRKTPELIRLERVILDVVNAYEEKTGMKLFVHAKDPNLKKFRGGNYRIIIEKLNN